MASSTSNFDLYFLVGIGIKKVEVFLEWGMLASFKWKLKDLRRCPPLKEAFPPYFRLNLFRPFLSSFAFLLLIPDMPVSFDEVLLLERGLKAPLI
jgi:hypothetical protein